MRSGPESKVVRKKQTSTMTQPDNPAYILRRSKVTLEPEQQQGRSSELGRPMELGFFQRTDSNLLGSRILHSRRASGRQKEVIRTVVGLV